MFSQKYRLGSKKEESEGNTYHVLSVEPAGKVDEATYKLAEGLYEQFGTKAKDLKVHEDNQAAETESVPEENK